MGAVPHVAARQPSDGPHLLFEVEVYFV